MNSTDKRLSDEWSRAWTRVKPWAIRLFWIGCAAAGFALMGVLR